MAFFNVPAAPIRIHMDDKWYDLEPRKFKSGSVGWFLGGKAMLGGHRVQLSFSAVVVGSKPPEELIDVLDEEDLFTKAPKAVKRGRKPSKLKPAPNPSDNHKLP